MTHQFDPEVAARLGINQAIVLYNLAYLQTQRAMQGGEEYFFGDRWWVRHSYESLAEWHKFLSVPQMKRVMKSLIEEGHVVTRHPERFNRTTYWSVAPDFIHSTESNHAGCEIVPSQSTKSYVVQHENNIRTDIEIDAKKIPPQIEQVQAYCDGKELFYVDPEDFMNYYGSIGWKVGGKARMKDWTLAACGWNNREKKKQKARGSRARI